jgi:GNAT superfamily N-acetyltransferase
VNSEWRSGYALGAQKRSGCNDSWVLSWEVVSYDDVAVQLLVGEVQAEYVERYGSPDVAPIELDEFTPPAGAFLLGRLDGQPVAMGAYRRHADDVAEIKRMYVRRPWRRRGIARELLAELEARAFAAGYRRAVLETGAPQPEALALYAASGWTPIPGYGYYRDSPASRCFGKDLRP